MEAIIMQVHLRSSSSTFPSMLAKQHPTHVAVLCLLIQLQTGSLPSPTRARTCRLPQLEIVTVLLVVHRWEHLGLCLTHDCLWHSRFTGLTKRNWLILCRGAAFRGALGSTSQEQDSRWLRMSCGSPRATIQRLTCENPRYCIYDMLPNTGNLERAVASTVLLLHPISLGLIAPSGHSPKWILYSQLLFSWERTIRGSSCSQVPPPPPPHLLLWNWDHTEDDAKKCLQCDTLSQPTLSGYSRQFA